MAKVNDVLDFWFGEIREDQKYLQERNRMWFGGGKAVDDVIREKFEPLLQELMEGKHAEWASHPAGRLATILVLDQFPRNLYRGTAQAFAYDLKALALCKEGLDLNQDKQLHPVQRLFFYLPLEHSENLKDQELSVRLFTELARKGPFEEALNYAVRHFEIIRDFKRFPHRNKALGRTSTPEEVEFLKSPNSSF